MKKRNDEELDDLLDEEEFLDDEEILDDEELDDEIIDEDDEEEFEDEPKKKKGKKLAKEDKKGKKGKKAKKKLSKGAIAGIVVGSVAVVAALVVLAVFVIMPLFAKEAVVASDFQELLQVNGYQNYEATKANVKLKNGATDLVTVDDMIAATGWNYQTHVAEFAAGLYSLAITNYQKVAGTGWYCYTDSSVYASDVKALSVAKFPTFKVGVRAAFGMGSLEPTAANEYQKEQEKDNFFSQTISGVTVLDIEGITPTLTDTLKTKFGYNCQEYLYNGTYAYKRGSNGGANFYGKSSAEGYKYMMGAYNEDLYLSGTEKPYKVNGLKDSGYPEHTYFSAEFSAEYGETKSLEKVECPDDIPGGSEPWGKLATDYDYAYELTPYNETYKYYYGNYGAGWAVYDFSKDNIDASKTTITYDAKGHFYTINMVVKESKVDDACMFAKGSLTKDTKDYIQLQNAKYSLKKNMIQIYDNGLIKYWERVESVDSSLKAKLTVLPGECAGGGGTENSTYMSFSYSPIDYHPQALAARYMTEIASETGITGWPTLANYDPKNTDYTTLKVK